MHYIIYIIHINIFLTFLEKSLQIIYRFFKRNKFNSLKEFSKRVF